VVDPAVARALLAADAGTGAVGVEVAAARCGPLLVSPRWVRPRTDTDTDTGSLDAFVSRREVSRIAAGGWAARVDSAQGRRVAFRQLFEACRKPVDGIVARHLNRHVSIFISKRVVGTPLTPNMISCVTFAISVAGAVSAAMGGWLPVMVGAFLFQWASILDGVDGELARVRFQHSKLGQWLDTISDDASNVLFYAGLGIGARSLPFGEVLMGCGLASSLLHVITSAIHYQELYTLGSGDLYAIDWGFDKEPPAGLPGKMLVFFRNVVKKDFATLFFFVLSVFGVLAWFLPGIVIAQVSALVAAVARRVRRARGG
jgi:1L-myo-inositol 1-phosphate cytidylyltransferase / CDP-L-myo-inositol myo-inositolphosphotransferase